MNYKKTILNNGLTVLSVPQEECLSSYILILIKVGSLYEDKKIAGISHFLEHMTFKGTKNFPSSLKLSFELEKIGAQYNAFTSHELTGYFIKVQKKYLETGLELIKEMFFNPLYPEQEAEKEKGVIIEEINMHDDRPEFKVQENFDSFFYGAQPAGRPIAGFKETVKKISKSDLLKFRKEFYVPKSIEFVLAGFQSSSILKKIEKDFGKIKKAKPKKYFFKELKNKEKIFLESKETQQTNLVLGFPAFSFKNPLEYHLRLLGGVLGQGISSRIFQAIREKLGAAYKIYSSAFMSEKFGNFTISAGLEHSKTEKAISLILKELKKLKNQKISEKELKKAKDFSIGNLFLSLETPADWAEFYATMDLLRGKIISPLKIASKINKISSAELLSLANKIFSFSKMKLSLLGPIKNKSRIEKIIKQ